MTEQADSSVVPTGAAVTSPAMSTATPPPDAVERAVGGLVATAPAAIDAEVERLLAELTADEKLGLLSGDGPLVAGTLDMARRYNGEPIVAASVPRLGLPGIRFTDGPRGVVMYRSTAFPSSMARAATFDPALEARIGDAIGVEARTQGANLFAGVCVNLLRHPAWGRAQETYGEDPHLLGEMGAALVRGAQRHVLACVKHFAANSMENSRFWVDVQIEEADLRDLYLPHFKRCVDAGVAAVMTAYNKVNGVPCGHHPHLVTDILKGEWGFDGVVMSDFTLGVRNARAAVLGGQDLEMPFGMVFRRLPSLVRRGAIPQARIDDAARRILRAQVRVAGFGEPARYRQEVVAGPEHRALARLAAAQGMVLLRNEPVASAQGADAAPVLPLSASTTSSVAVVGRLAASPNLGDLGSSQVHPPSVVTPLEGIAAAGGWDGIDVRHHDGTDVAGAASLAASCDVVVVVVGSDFHDEGEWVVRSGGDRSSLRLRAADEKLVEAVARANPRVAVVLVGGSAFVTDPWIGEVGAVLVAWYPGMEGGHALADVLFGEVEPGGRLPCTWPTSATVLPPFRRFARTARYGPLHGYRLMEASGQQPAFWFGHGLGYTTTEWSSPRLVSVSGGDDGSRVAVIEVTVANPGGRDALDVVQAYVPEVLGTHPHPLNTLRGFARVLLTPGASAVARVAVVVPATADRVLVGRSADPAGLVGLPLDPPASA